MVNKKKKAGRKLSASPIAKDEQPEPGELVETPVPPIDDRDSASDDHSRDAAAAAAAAADASQTPEIETVYKDTCTPEHFKQPNLTEESCLMNTELSEKIKAMESELKKMTEDKARDIATNLESENKIAELTSQLASSNERLRVTLEQAKFARENAELFKESVEDARREEQQKSAEALKFEIESRECIDTELSSLKDRLKEREHALKDLSEKLQKAESDLKAKEADFEGRAAASEQALQKSQQEVAELKEQINALQADSKENSDRVEQSQVAEEISKAVDSVHETVRSKIRKFFSTMELKYPDRLKKVAAEKSVLENLPDSATAVCALENFCSLNEDLFEQSQDLQTELASKQKQLDLLTETMAKADQKEAELREQFKQEVERLTALSEAELEKVRAELEAELQSVKGESAKALAEKSAEIERLSAEKEALEQKMSQLDADHQSELQRLEDELKEVKGQLSECAAELALKKSMLLEVEEIAKAHERGYAECLEQLERAAEETVQLTSAIDQHKIDEERRFEELKNEHAEAIRRCIKKTEGEISAQAEIIREKLSQAAEENSRLKEDLKFAEEELVVKEKRIAALDAALSQAHADRVDVQRKAEITIADFNKQKIELQNIMHEFNNQLASKTGEIEQLEQTLRTQIKDQLEQQYKKQIETLQKRLNGSSRAIIELETELGQKNLAIGNLTEKIRIHEQQALSDSREGGARGASSSLSSTNLTRGGAGGGFFRFF